MKISNARWNTRVTISARMAPYYGITEQTRWKPSQTQTALKFRPATQLEIENGETWPTQDLRKSKGDYKQYTLNIPKAWTHDLDTRRGVIWKESGGVLWGEIPKKQREV